MHIGLACAAALLSDPRSLDRRVEDPFFEPGVAIVKHAASQREVGVVAVMPKLIEPLLGLLSRALPALHFNGLKPLLLSNVALLGLSLQVIEGGYGALQTLAWSLGGGLGFWLALSLFADLRQRSDNEAIPESFRGLPVELIGAGVMALAFLGFNGLFTT